MYVLINKMDDQESQHDTQKKPHRTGFGVEASPFNSVKLELGFVIIFGIVLWIGIDIITPSMGKQLMILAGYGLLGALWLIFRTRRVLKHQDPEQD